MKKNAAQQLANIIEQKDALFIDMVNTMLSNYESLSGKSVPVFKSIGDLVKHKRENSALLALIDKLYHMAYNLYSPQSIPGFLNRIITRKKQLAPTGYNDDNKIYGTGHFKWDWKAYTLDDNEVNAIRMFLERPLVDNGNTHGSAPDQLHILFKNVVVTGRFAKGGCRFPNTDKDDKTNHNKFIITLRNKTTGIEHEFNFYGSHKDWEAGIKTISKELLHSALESFFLDATSGDMGYEEFCSELGYETDSRRAEKIFAACEESCTKAKDLFGDIYKAANDFSDFEINPTI